MENAGPHMHQHLNMLRGDPTRKLEVKQKEKQLDQLGKISDAMGQQMQEALRAHAEQNPPNGEQPTPEMAKVMGDLGLKKIKTEGEMALKAHKQEISDQLADKKTAAGIARDNAVANAAAARPKPQPNSPKS